MKASAAKYKLEGKMKVAFKDDSFAFEFVRNLGFTYYGGADLGEMMATAGKIKEGDFESWFTEWDKVGRRVLSRADAGLAAGHLESAREGYLRASTYFRTAEFYLHGNPADPRILSESRASQKAYAEAARLAGPTWEPVRIPYEGTTLPGYFYKVDNSGKPRPTLIFHGGFDSSVEELFFFGGAAAVRRGYNCLTFDGPGQGAPMREQKLLFRYDWEAVVTPAVRFPCKLPTITGACAASASSKSCTSPSTSTSKSTFWRLSTPNLGPFRQPRKRTPNLPWKAPVNRFRLPLAPASNPSAAISAASRPEPITH